MLQRQGVSVKKDGEMGTNRDPIEGTRAHRLHRNTLGGCQNPVTVRNKLFIFMLHTAACFGRAKEIFKEKKIYIET